MNGNSNLSRQENVSENIKISLRRKNLFGNEEQDAIKYFKNK